MRKLFARRPSPSMVVAVIALCFAVAGTAVAAKKIKLGKNTVTTKSIKNNAVTESKITAGAVTEKKIAAGAVTAGKVASSAKPLWVETDISAATVARQSGGVTMVANGTGSKVIDFGTDVSKRAITANTLLTLGETTIQYGRCLDIGCPAPYADSPNAIATFTFDATTNALVTTGFTVAALP